MTSSIPRHKTAIRRSGLSVPVKCLLRDGLLHPSTHLFDYGCGHGQDIELLTKLGITCNGWDPAYRSNSEKMAAPVVNLGYVINVIEEPLERREVVREAWNLCEDVLTVAALNASDPHDDTIRTPYNDGHLTTRGTFQRYYTHQELRSYLEELLGVEAVPAAPNIYYLFKSEERRQSFLANRYRRVLALPRMRVSEQLFEQHRNLLEPFMVVLSELGRLPLPDELPQSAEIIQTLGSLKRAFQIVARVTGQNAWEEIAAKRREDLLVYLALAHFGSRRPLSKLPMSIQRDIKAFMGTYKKATDAATTLLFSVGNTGVIDTACCNTTCGHLVDNALVIHRRTLEKLPPVLRVFEGCACAILGQVDGTDVIKLHRFSGKVTYMRCPDLMRDTNPSVSLRIKVNLRTLDIDYFDYSQYSEQPRLNFPVEDILPKDYA